MVAQHSKGRLLVFSAPSGSGKTTLVKHLLETFDNMAFSVSATSRAARKGEKDGLDYYFLSTAAFRQKIDEQAFLEWEEVYPDVFYGTLLSEVERLRNQGKNVLFDVDVVGGLNIKKHYGSEALAIFVKAPSIEELEKRLKQRSTDDAESIAKRVSKARWELGFADQFDMVLINDQLEEAKKSLIQIVQNFLKQ